MAKKIITQFDVFNKMPKESIDIFIHSVGGRSLGKKNNNNAVIEVLVDNETFQDFVFQKTYGESRANKKRKYYMFYAIDADEYDKQNELLKNKNSKTITIK